MIKKWEQRVICMNFKKAVIIFYITGLVMAAAVPAALCGNRSGKLRGNTGKAKESAKENAGKAKENERKARRQTGKKNGSSI